MRLAMEGQEEETGSGVKGSDSTLAPGKDASSPDEKSNPQPEGQVEKERIQGNMTISKLPGMGGSIGSEVGTCGAEGNPDRRGADGVANVQERTPEGQGRVLQEPEASGTSKVTNAFRAEEISEHADMGGVEAIPGRTSEEQSRVLPELPVESSKPHLPEDQDSGRTEIEEVTGTPERTTARGLEEVHRRHAAILDIAEKLKMLESNLDVNILDQFEAFVRSQTGVSRASDTDRGDGSSGVGELVSKVDSLETHVRNSGGDEEGLQTAIQLAIAKKKRSLIESQAGHESSESNRSVTACGASQSEVQTELEVSSLSGTESVSGKRERSPGQEEFTAAPKCARLEPVLLGLEGGPEKPSALMDVPTAETCEVTGKMIDYEENEDGMHPAMETGEEQELANADGLVQTCTYHYSEDPLLLTSAQDEFLTKKDNFLKGCKWSPDGTCILTNSDDGTLRLFNLPPEFYNPQTMGPGPPLKAVLEVVEGELIYDYSWYPQMSSLAPETCCFASTSRGHPVHMWDAFTGQLRCSYRPHDHLDELISPHSVGFSLDGAKLYCGCNKLIKVFDISRPGKACDSKHTKGKLGGQTGIISCFSMSPYGDTYAAGSYSKTIGIYTDSCPSAITVLHGQSSGVTQLMYSIDGTRLYSGGRKDNEVLCWDVRRSNEVLFRLKRNVKTNQRIYFDIDRDDHYLVTGNQNGSVSIWDLYQLSIAADESPYPVIEPQTKFTAHEDTTNGVSIHPWLPLLATASGQRVVPPPTTAGSDGESGDESDIQQPSKGVSNSLRIWSLYSKAAA